MEEQTQNQEQQVPNIAKENNNPYIEPKVQEDVPNATAVLVLGIISLASFWCYGIVGIVLGIIGLAISSSSHKAIKLEPQRYTQSSIKNLNAGRIMSIIGLSVGGLFILIIVLYFLIIGAALMSPAFM
jgi:hypothetical protein